MNVPYFCQWDNAFYPGGSCNLTSTAMVLEYFGKGGNVAGSDGLPDRLLRYCDDRGLDRHTLETIDYLLEKFGVSDRSGYNVTFDQIKAALQKGQPVIVHGVFTPSGHIVVVCGFDSDKGLWKVNDPAGRWDPVYHYCGPKWQPGKGVWYDSAWFRAKAAPDGKVWAHLCSKK